MDKTARTTHSWVSAKADWGVDALVLVATLGVRA
jgi:hypothetical protein